jgi:UDP-N-acetylmuramate--alanine ligase
MKYYLSGIAGTGMNVLAQYLVAHGNKVYGSDRNFDRNLDLEYKDFLESKNIIIVPQDGKIITRTINHCIFSAAVEPTVPDYKKALALKIPVMTRSQLLKTIFNEKKSIGIAGTSGKTTVTGMLATIFKETGSVFTLFCGAEILNYMINGVGGNFFYGNTDFLLAEVDESDKVINQYASDIAAVLNITEDHMPLHELKPLFSEYMNLANQVVYNKDCPVLNTIIKKINKPKISFSIKDKNADIFIENIRLLPEASSFTVQDISFSLQLPGKYNIENAAAAIATAHAKGIPLPKIARVLYKFQGIKGRYEKISETKKRTVIYDFAHNPAKIDSLLQTATSLNPSLIFYYQPHSYNAFRNQLNSLVEIFSKRIRQNDILLIGKIYDAGGTVDRNISSSLLVKKLVSSPIRVFYTNTRHRAKRVIKKSLINIPVCLIVGARDRSLRSFAQSL